MLSKDRLKQTSEEKLTMLVGRSFHTFIARTARSVKNEDLTLQVHCRGCFTAHITLQADFRFDQSCTFIACRLLRDIHVQQQQQEQYLLYRTKFTKSSLISRYICYRVFN